VKAHKICSSHHYVFEENCITVFYHQEVDLSNGSIDLFFKKVLDEFFRCYFLISNQSRTDLEAQTLETSSTSDAVHLITFVQNLKRKHTVWDQLVPVSHSTCVTLVALL